MRALDVGWRHPFGVKLSKDSAAGRISRAASVQPTEIQPARTASTSSKMAVDLEEVRDYLVDLAYKAGEKIATSKPIAAGSGTKKNSADLVTETDQAVEK